MSRYGQSAAAPQRRHPESRTSPLPGRRATAPTSAPTSVPSARVALVAVSGIADHATAHAVTSRLRALPGVLRVVFDLAPGAGSPMLVEYQPPASRESITGAVKALGFEIPIPRRDQP